MKLEKKKGGRVVFQKKKKNLGSRKELNFNLRIYAAHLEHVLSHRDRNDIVKLHGKYKFHERFQDLRAVLHKQTQVFVVSGFDLCRSKRE